MNYRKLLDGILLALLLLITIVVCDKARAAGHTYTITVEGEMKENVQFENNITVIEKLQPEDTLKVYINSIGGSVSVYETYVFYMHKSGATIIMIVPEYALAESAAAMLAATGNKIIFYPHAKIMFHNAYVILLDGSIIPQPSFTHQELELCCTNILSQNEIFLITQGNEVWLSGNEVMKRLGLAPLDK